MHIISEIIVAILTTYLAFTNTLADKIQYFFNLNEEESAEVQEIDAPEQGFSSLPGLAKQSIPDILLRSASYQAAAVAGSAGLTGATTKDPFEAIVNIFCTMTTEEEVRTTTGSGFFIDPDGVIMTNAHVAQFLILENSDEMGEVNCIVRNGNPASPRYKAELLYLPPAWIQANATVITDEVPMGTGERDYALLYVSEAIDENTLPDEFPALGFSTDLLPLSTRNKEVLAAGYPAEPILRSGASADLIPQKATTTVSELYTFGSNTADVFSIRGSRVGTEGSSGGPVLNVEGEVIGIIVTRGDDDTDGAGSLRAITLSHIEQTLVEETNFSLLQNISGDFSYRATVFAETITPFLLEQLQRAN